MRTFSAFRSKVTSSHFFYFAVLPALFVQLVATYLFLFPYAETELGQWIYAVNKAVLILWPVAWVWLAGVKGWPFLNGEIKKSLKWGALFGAAIIAVVLGLYFAFTDFWWGFLPNLQSAVKSLSFLEDNYLLFAFFLSLIHSFIEEYFWRWFVVNGLMVKFKKWTAAVIGGIAFAVHHALVVSLLLPLGLSLLMAFGIFVLAMIWSAIYFNTKSLYGCWISHFCADAVVMGVGYVMLF